MSIKTQLQSLSEDDLRQKIIMPLLFALGCGDVRDNCSPTERGKDVIYVTRNHFLREKVWGAVLVKKTDIGKASLENINRQLVEAINQFVDPDEPRNRVQLSEIIVMTSRTITSEAAEYIHSQSGKNFQNIHLINGDRMDFLVNKIIVEINQKNGGQYTFNVETFGDFCGRTFT